MSEPFRKPSSRPTPQPSRPPRPTSPYPGGVPPVIRAYIGWEQILVMSLIVAVVVLLGIGGMFWLISDRLVFAPTPTPTQTPGPPFTPTPDFRATRVVEDMLTQEAERIAAGETPLLTPSPTSEVTATEAETPTPTEIVLSFPNVSGGGDATPTETPTAAVSPLQPESPLEIPTDEVPVLDLNTPAIATAVALATLNAGANGPAADTPTGTAEVAEVVSPLATPTANMIILPIVSIDGSTLTPPPTPTVEVQPVADTPTPIPIEPTQIVEVPPTPSPTPIPPTATITPTPTPLPYTVASLSAVVRDVETDVRLGPSNIYSITGSLSAGADINILGRSPSGEWVYICCAVLEDNRNITAWVRRAYLIPRDNELGPGAPEDADPNDVRWLSIQPLAALQPPLPTQTPIPADDFPLYRYAPDGRGRLPDLPNPPMDYAWPNQAQAGGSLISPVLVSGSSILVASADNHLYSFDRLNGNQRWRYALNQSINFAPIASGARIYAVEQGGRMLALEDRGNEAVLLWEQQLSLPPIGGMNIYTETLYIPIGNDTTRQVITVDRNNGQIRDIRSIAGSGPRYPVIGDQLLYMVDNRLVAYDVHNFEEVWSRPEIVDPTSLPIYAWPGVAAVADLYIATANNRIYSIDANTGDIRWEFDNGEIATSLSANSANLFAAGDGYVKAISRDTHEQVWRAPVPGQVLGGPLVDDEQVLVFTSSGNVLFINAATGSINNNAGIPSEATVPGAVSGEWVYVPGANGTLYALRMVP